MVKKGGGLHQDGTGGQSLCRDPFGQFVERELCIVVYRRMENWRMSRSGASLQSSSQDFWQSYKFMNPVTKKAEPKQMHCERLDEAAVCEGIYQ